MFVLDTNVVSELRKVRAGKADPGVSRWVAGVPSAQLFVSAMTIHELELGVLLAERRDRRQGEMLRQWLDESVAGAFADRVLAIDDAVAKRAAGLHVPDPAPLRDAFIAAAALDQRMAVVTRNVKDFERFDGLTVVNPWS